MLKDTLYQLGFFIIILSGSLTVSKAAIAYYVRINGSSLKEIRIFLGELKFPLSDLFASIETNVFARHTEPAKFLINAPTYYIIINIFLGYVLYCIGIIFYLWHVIITNNSAFAIVNNIFWASLMVFLMLRSTLFGHKIKYINVSS